MLVKFNKAVVRFDSKVIERRVDKARIRGLIIAGYRVRKAARQSMRRRKTPSRPGQPPRVVGGELKNFLSFAYDRRTNSTVIGPEARGKAQAPSVLERGGVVTSRRRSRSGGRRTIRSKVQSRPYMAPAMEKVRPDIPEIMAGEIRIEMR